MIKSINIEIQYGFRQVTCSKRKREYERVTQIAYSSIQIVTSCFFEMHSLNNLSIFVEIELTERDRDTERERKSKDCIITGEVLSPQCNQRVERGFCTVVIW